MHDIIIIGGGIVGLATALKLQEARNDLRIVVLEKETEVAQHQSSRNSGVLHSGIYYRPGSLRASNCIRGYRYMLDFCEKNEIKHDVCGKIIVASREEERAQIDKILVHGEANGLKGLKRIGPDEIREIEPCVEGVEAIFVPQAGIVDYGEVARKYAELICDEGGNVIISTRVKNILIRNKSVVAQTTTGDYEAKMLINCAGLYSDRVAKMAGLNPETQILPFRGEYYELKKESTHLVNNLIYPVPNPAFPFLGVHFTRMIQGGIEAGPNAVLAFAREGYTKTQINAAELAAALRFRGFRKLAIKYRKEAFLEFQRSYSRKHFVRALRNLIPDIKESDVVPGRAGVRAMACKPDGQLLDDFVIIEKPHMVHVLNAPSPAATASLSVGETIAKTALRQF